MQAFAAVLVLSLFCNGSLGQTGITNQRLFDTIPFIPDHNLRRQEQFRLETVPPGRVIFLGNSITEAGDWKKLTGDTTAVNRGIGGEITFSLLKRITDITALRPSKVFLMIGINDIGKDIPPAVIAHNIGLIIGRIQAESPGTVIILQNILPVNPTVAGFPQHYDKNDKVTATNKLLPGIAAGHHVPLVDLNRLFRDKDGYLKKELTKDGLHLDPGGEGYTLWIRHLKKLGYLP
jgi:lysophospholipase L1-like esterase